MGGIARYFININNQSQIPKAVAFAKEKDIPLHILGGGSNTIFNDAPIQKLVLRMRESYIRILDTYNKSVFVEVGAGTNWDAFVEWTIQHTYSGIEALSGIPGTVGASPVQNIGAYGQELKDVLVEVRAYDIKHNQFVSILAQNCAFTYRSSIFKEQARGRYIIASILCKLSLTQSAIPNYPDIQNYFAQKNIPRPSLADIRAAILEIRSQKLPNPNIIPNVGSFFKNPIIQKTQAQKLKEQFPDIKSFPVSETRVKIPAGWLIEQCGFKGLHIGPIGVYEKNALILTNPNNASCMQIIEARDTITQCVQKKFGIMLEMEPEMVY
jgi:UDP-N-acetylmuramate dehydrogenase